jgi:tetratricopeptide (TPR) repeat protein
VRKGKSSARAKSKTARKRRFRLRKSKLWTFAGQLFWSRNPKRLVKGLPSLLLACVVIGFVWLAEPDQQGDLTSRYLRAADRALERNDPTAADLYVRRVVSESKANLARVYSLATLTFEKESEELGRLMMARLAPANARGYAPAHLWQAKHLLDRLATLSIQDLEVLEQHLHHTLASPGGNADAAVLLARLYVLTNRLAEAVQVFETVAPARPEVHLDLARLKAHLGRTEEAKQHAQQAAEHNRLRLAVAPEDTDARLAVARCEVLLGNASQALIVLQQGIKESHDRRLRDALVELYVLVSDNLRNRENARIDLTLQVLEKALNIDPAHELVLERLSSLSEQPGPEREKARHILQQSIAYGHESAAAHFVLGTIELFDEDYSSAIQHLSKALELRPEMPGAMNNLAWCLAYGPEPNLDRALQLVNQALEIAPERPEFLDTRGQVYARLGHWKKAIPDLETAASGIPGRVEVHETLALAYGKIGREEKANHHYSRIQEIQSAGDESESVPTNPGPANAEAR